MLNRQPEATGSGRAYHHPKMVSREVFVAKGFGKRGIVDSKIIPPDPLLGHTSRSSGFEDIEGATLIGLGYPNFIGLIA